MSSNTDVPKLQPAAPPTAAAPQTNRGTEDAPASSTRITRRPVVALLMFGLMAAGTGCDASGGATTAETEPPPDVPAASTPERRRADPSLDRALRDPAVAEQLRRCPVTEPNGSVPPGEQTPPQPPTGYYGNGELWTVLFERGAFVGEDILPDGTISMKFPWWRGVTGRLRITGRRLDRPAGKLRARIPRGYGPTGFQSTAIEFPTPGCWEVTGRAGRGKLAFVTLALKARPQ